jgi:hypothetical protein
VADSAWVYLEEKEYRKGRQMVRRLLTGATAGILMLAAGLYYLLFHVLSGVRV